VVARQDDDGPAESRELGPHEVDGIVGHPVVVEEIAGDQQEIDLVDQRAIDDPLEYAPAALLMRGLLSGVSVAVALEVDIGGVQHAYGASRSGHGSSMPHFQCIMPA
jgi:hypothetical protein